MVQKPFYSANMKNSSIIGYIGIILIGVFILVAVRNYIDGYDYNNDIVKDVLADSSETQVVELSMQNYNYYPQTINLKYNVPAKIVVDTKSVVGCLRSIVIPDFKVRELITEKDNVIRFTPDKKGTFSYSCSMGMGFGRIIVS